MAQRRKWAQKDVPSSISSRLTIGRHRPGISRSIRARHAIAYHFFNEHGTRYGIYQGVRETYSGPMSLAVDNMVWNITKDKITERMTVSPDQAWSVPGPKPSPSPVTGVAGPLNEAMKDGKGDVSDAQDAMVNSFQQEHDFK